MEEKAAEPDFRESLHNDIKIKDDFSKLDIISWNVSRIHFAAPLILESTFPQSMLDGADPFSD